jgi:hypothetical protein
MYGQSSLYTKEKLFSYDFDALVILMFNKLLDSKGVIKSPLRKDTKASLIYYKTETDYFFKDMATGQSWYGYDFFIEWANGLTNAFKIIESQRIPLRIIPVFSKRVPNKPTKIGYNKRKWKKEEVDWWLKQGIDENILLENVFPCTQIFIEKENRMVSVSKTIYNYLYLFPDGSCKVYMPFAKQNEFKFLTNSKYLQGLNLLEHKSKYLIWTKSFKDVLALKSMGIDAVAEHSEVVLPREKAVIYFKNHYAKQYCFLDNDKTGLESMSKIVELYPQIQPIWLPPKAAKDLTDLVRIIGKESAYQTLIKQMRNCNLIKLQNLKKKINQIEKY